MSYGKLMSAITIEISCSGRYLDIIYVKNAIKIKEMICLFCYHSHEVLKYGNKQAMDRVP